MFSRLLGAIIHHYACIYDAALSLSMHMLTQIVSSRVAHMSKLQVEFDQI